MNRTKRYLFPTGGSHFLGGVLLVFFLGVALYDLWWGSHAFLREGNVYVEHLLLFLVLLYISISESCMMITTSEYLFAYRVDKAICLPIPNDDLKSAVSQAQKLYGPIFGQDCERQFSSKPTSTVMRKCFYALAIVCFIVSLTSPVCHMRSVAETGLWSGKLISAWILVVIDAALLVNRMFFRASIRKFWANTLGGDSYRAVVEFELSRDDG